MKKILSMILCLSMFLVPILTGCAQGDSSETDDVVADTEEVRYPMTLSLWLPTSEKTTDEAIALVEAEINKYTTSTYDTEIELHAINEADYAKAIEDKLTSIDDVKKAQERAKEEAEQQKVNDIYSGIVRDTAEPEEVEPYIHSCGFYHTKAKDIVDCARVLAAKHGGKVPDNMEELLKLPGVGRKTAAYSCLKTRECAARLFKELAVLPQTAAFAAWLLCLADCPAV